MTKKLTREELRTQRRGHFFSVSGIVLDILRCTTKHRAVHLADGDNTIVHNTTVALEYARTRVSNWPNLLLTDELESMTKYLRACTVAWQHASILPTDKGDIPMVPVVDIERLGERLDQFITYAVGIFDDARYNKKPWWRAFVYDDAGQVPEPVGPNTMSDPKLVSSR